MSSPSRSGRVEVMEVFGGLGGVSKIAIRRKLVTGENFDVVTGTDLSVPANQRSLEEYVRKHKPLVIVGGPPCTAFGNWSRLNRVNAPETYAKSRRSGLASSLGGPRSMAASSGLIVLHLVSSEESNSSGSLPLASQEPE